MCIRDRRRIEKLNAQVRESCGDEVHVLTEEQLDRFTERLKPTLDVFEPRFLGRVDFRESHDDTPKQDKSPDAKERDDPQVSDPQEQEGSAQPEGRQAEVESAQPTERVQLFVKSVPRVALSSLLSLIHISEPTRPY